MQFKADKQELKSALAVVSKAVSAKTSIPVLECVRCVISEGALQLTGYDLEIGIMTTIGVETFDSGMFAVDPKLFGGMISKMPGNEIEIIMEDNSSVTLRSGKTKFDINVIDAADYPELPDFEKNSKIEIPQSILKSMITQTLFAVALNDNKPVLTGELFELQKGNFTVAALDGYRLAVRMESVSITESYKFVVPAKALREVAGILSDKSEVPCAIHPGKKHISFSIGDYTVFSRLLEGEFHNFKASITPSAASEVIIKTRELIDCLERCAVIVNDRVKAPVRCIFGNSIISVSCETAIGKIHEEIEVDFAGAEVEIGFNCKYLLDALKSCESDQAKLQINGGTSPMKVVPLEGESYLFLVLPVRLKG